MREPRFQTPFQWVPVFLALAWLPAGGIQAGAETGNRPLVPYGTERLLELRMPREAARAFSSLPGPERARHPALPRLLRDLADVGAEEEALSLFDSIRNQLAGPVRAQAFLAAAKIRWRRKEHAHARNLLAEIPPGSAEGREAALFLARDLASRGDPDGAFRTLAGAPDDALKRLLAGEIEVLRGNGAAAASLWADAPPGTPAGEAARRLLLRKAGDRDASGRALRAMADNAAGRFPETVEALRALAEVRLLAGDRAMALDAAREGISASERWRVALDGLPPWDGTLRGADRSLDSASALFPLGEDVAGFRPAGRRFLSLAALRSTLEEAESRARSLSGEVRRLADGVRKRKALLAEKLERVGRIRGRLLDDARRAAGIPARISRAADDLSLPEWAERSDPQVAALLDGMGDRLSSLSRTISRLKSSTQATVDWQDTKSLSPEDRRMVFFARERIAKAEATLENMEARSSLLRARVWNRWKESYSRRASRVLDGAETGARRAEEQAKRTERVESSLRAAIGNLSGWETALASMEATLGRDASALRAWGEATARLSAEAFARARRETLPGVVRKERALRHLAGRAAAEWHFEGRGAPGDNAAVPAGLLQEGIRHLEASLPPPGEREPLADESIYALAALRFEEAERRYYGGKEGDRRDAPDFSAPTDLFRKLLSEHPQSPYGEAARYGLALCFQESGAADNAAEALEALLARHPSTGYADEANLRLAEYRFDRFDFPGAEAAYRKVRPESPPELRTTARFKLGWALFLQNRPGEAAEAFLEAALLSPSAARTGGLREEARRMTARSLVEAGTDREAESFLSLRRGDSEGPAVLLGIGQILDSQNRYEEAAGTATRLGFAYPLAAERLDAEEGAAVALRKAKREDEGMARRGAFHALLGPGTAWQKAPGRTGAEIARADSLAMEGLAAAGFHFHAAARERPPGDRARILALYDAFLARFPSSPKAEEVAYQRAWLLFEDGRKGEAVPAFEAVGRRPGGSRGEAARYMALQGAKDIAAPGNAGTQGEIVRLAREYEQAFPRGERRLLVLLDRARAHFHRKEYDEAAEAALDAGKIASDPADRRTAHRLAGEARFEAGRYPEAEREFRDVLAASPSAAERGDVEKWVGFSMFRTAERFPKERGGDAGALFLKIAGDFPTLEIVPEARFRAGVAYEESGKETEAIGAYLSVETLHAASPLAADATRRLVTLYERGGNPVPAAERLARLSGLERTDEKKAGYLFRAAELYQKGTEEERARRAYLDAAALPEAPAPLRVLCLFRAGESARAHGAEGEADAHYAAAVRLHREKDGAAPEIAGRALFQRAEARLRAYLPMRIVPPLETTFAEKQKALEGCAELYAEALRVGDAGTVTASLQRIGEAFEDFRAAILASPPPAGLTSAEKEEYVFLLEERAAPIEEKAVESYRNNLRQAVAAGHFSPWVAKSRERLRALRPALFGRKAEFAFPVVPVPDFLGITERGTP